MQTLARIACGMRSLLILTVALSCLAPQARAAHRNPPASFERFDLIGSPRGIATEMPCTEARKHLMKHGMMPFDFVLGVGRGTAQRPPRDTPHAVLVTLGDYKAFPNV